jgi:asparagine synthase (glutamine-hydrolysing)
LRDRGWRRDFQRGPFSIWLRGERLGAVHWLEDLQIAVVGRLFARTDELRPRSSRPPSTGPGPIARAATLCATHWGHYVAFPMTTDGGEIGVFRDPSGALDAFTWRRGALRLAAGSLEAVAPQLLPDRMSLDWDIISDFIHRPVSLNGPIALRGLEAVTPGTFQALGALSASAATLWEPSDFLTPPAGSECDWMQALRDTIADTVRRCVEPYASVVAETSGGLDSSIVAACLVQTGLGDRVSGALNYVGDRREGDESRWAKILTDGLGLPLEVVPRPLQPYDPPADFTPLARDARPPINALDPWRDRDTAQRLVAAGAQALVTGAGGDPLFFQIPTPLVIADLWRAKGWSAWRDPLTADLARVLRRSVWSVAGEALTALRHPEAVALETHPKFAGPRAAASAVRTAAHPWLARLDEAPPGKALQIAALTATQPALGRNRRSEIADVVQPLLAQPVVELCLSIPTWSLVRGGRDRALAREAFRSWLPEAIVERRSKGLLTSFYARSAAASLEALREHLLGGVLADAGVLDRPAMEVALRPESLIWTADGLSLLRVAAVECWVRHWQTQVPDCREASRYRC